MNPAPNYPQQQSAYPQPQPIYPQPQPGYPQPVYPQTQPVYPQTQPVVITDDMRKMFGYAHCIRVFAIIEIVLDAISIIGLFFLAFPIAGKRITANWMDSDISCYEVWRLILFVLNVLSTVSCIFSKQWTVLFSSLVSCVITFWVYWLVHSVKVLKSQMNATSECLSQTYILSNTPCRCF